MEKNQYRKEPLKDNVEEMFIGPFGSSLKNECFVDERNAYCMVYEQKHAIQKTLAGKNRFVDRNKYQELKRFTVKPGDIIVSCRGTIGETFIIPENAPLGIMHPSIMKIRLKPNVYNIEYFNLLLKSRLEAYNKSANGSGVKMAISATELGKDLFPIPPMDEQQKISRIFFMVEHLMLLRKQQLAKMDELVKARFVEMFGDPISNPFGFKVESLQEMLDDNAITYHLDGNHGSDYPRNEEFVESGVSYISANCIIDDNVNLQLAKHLTEERAAKLRKGIAQDEDVLFAHNATVGPVAILHTRETKVVLGTSLTAYRCNKLRILPSYLKAYMQSEGFVRQYTKDMKQTTRNQVPITAQRKYLFIVPPLSLQNRFASFVERVDQQKQTVQQSLEKLELMKKALMQEYFG